MRNLLEPSLHIRRMHHLFNLAQVVDLLCCSTGRIDWVDGNSSRVFCVHVD
jgi:hypothetical protein